ncbi:hypothetical protein [Gordonia sp. KTR9]|uniref:hypothetical protein n=1 Tax=Gordonia sp. KTR9 TaxID=337191 RepID=UPI000299A610|nr:hypothetical protein [Gordonia sp. KTR9]ADK68990.2 hypothetical protein KTR9_4909 [Gordonia sp. KTR9]
MTHVQLPMERIVENHLVASCQRHDLLCLKVTSPARRAITDRLVIGHDDRSDPVVLFLELKRPGTVPRASQKAMFARMRVHGAHVVVADSVAAVDHYFLRTPIPIRRRDPQVARLPGMAPTVLVLDRGSGDSSTFPTTSTKDDPSCI